MRWSRARGTNLVLTFALALATAGGVPAASGVGGEWERFSQLGSEDFLSNVITAVVCDSAGRVWVGTDRGLAWTSDAGRTWNVVRLEGAHPRMAGHRGGPAPEESLAAEPLIFRNTVSCIAAGRSGVWVGTLNGLCFYNEDLQTWELCGWDRGGPGPEIWAVAEYLGEVWVSSATGLYKSKNEGSQWERLEGALPLNVRCISLGDYHSGRACWLSGFDAAPQSGGGPDIFRSLDGGKTWAAVKSGTASGLTRAVSARTNRLIVDGPRLWAATRNGLAVSRDGGDTWSSVSPGSGLTAEETFDLVVADNGLWAATSEGLFFSSDGGETWRHEENLACPVRILSRNERLLWMATSGGLLCRARKADWKTFSVQSNILCLAVTTDGATETWWAGTTGGLAYSREGGKTWRTLTVADGLPSNLVISLAAEGERIWAGTDGGICDSLDSGESWRCHSRENGLRGLHVRDLLLENGNVWAATNRGLSLLAEGTSEWRSFQATKEWHCICMVEQNLYGAVTDVVDAGRGFSVIMGNPAQENWRTVPLPRQGGYPIHRMFRAGDDVWIASDTGLFRGRDGGESWARFAEESLWSSRITQLCPGSRDLICVQALPNDPPAQPAFINVTRDDGRSWQVLPTAVPGRASAMMVAVDHEAAPLGQGDRLLVGSVQSRVGPALLSGGLWAYSSFERDFRPARTGWLMWNRLAGLAASTYRSDRLGWVSALDPFAFHGTTIWFGSAGSGVIERGVPILDDVWRAWDVFGQTPLNIHPFALLDGEEILAMADSADGMWFGAATGLHFYDRMGQWKSWRPAKDGLCAAPVRAVAVLGNEVWAGTDQGVSVLNRANGAWRTFAEGTSALPNNQVSALASDGERVWGGTAKGAFVVDRAGKWQLLSRPAEEKVSSVALGTARVYFGSDWGVFGLDFDGTTRRHLTKQNSPLPDNDVRQVFVDGPEIWAATRSGVGRILYDRAETPVPLEIEVSLRGPEGVLVVVNDNSEPSKQVGEEYRKLRNVPPENVCHIRCAPEETIEQAAFERDIRAPIRRHLVGQKLSRRISFIVTTLGVPLRIAPAADRFGAPQPAAGAAVDSELTVLSEPNPPPGPLDNPYFHRDEPFNSTLFGMFLVTRLDGPTLQDALSLTRDAVRVETDRSFGGRGFARFNVIPLEDETSERINAAILINYHSLSRLDRLYGRVVMPERSTLPFVHPDQAISSFFFLGWGLNEYRPEVFSWVQGAVAIDLDRMTASSLRDRKASWVAGALGGHVAATIGNVNDPGPGGAPSVASLFRSMKAGFSWAETAYMCIPRLSWQTVVIGDPLYTPLK